MWAKRQHDGGRARKRRHAVKARGGSPATVGGYIHKGLESRIGWLGDGAGSETWCRLICDERWQRVAAHRGVTPAPWNDSCMTARASRAAAARATWRVPCPVVHSLRFGTEVLQSKDLRWHDFNATRRCAKMLVGHCRT